MKDKLKTCYVAVNIYLKNTHRNNSLPFASIIRSLGLEFKNCFSYIIRPLYKTNYISIFYVNKMYVYHMYIGIYIYVYEISHTRTRTYTHITKK